MPAQDGQVPTGELAFAEAVSRNAPVEIVRLDGADDAPPGRGRMLELRERDVVLEKVQVIGKDVAFVAGSVVECYFNYKGQLFQFRSRIIESGQPFRLNDQFMVPGMTLERPSQITAGQRRRVFRVSLGSRTEPPRIEIWHAKTAEQSLSTALKAHEELTQQTLMRMKIDPSFKPAPLPAKPTLLDALDGAVPDYDGTVAEASDTGMGVVIEQCTYSRFKIFEHLAVRITLPDSEHPICFLAEVRHTREVREHTARLGLRLMDDPLAPQAFQRSRRRLVQFLQDAQRALRR